MNYGNRGNLHVAFDQVGLKNNHLQSNIHRNNIIGLSIFSLLTKLALSNLSHP